MLIYRSIVRPAGAVCQLIRRIAHHRVKLHVSTTILIPVVALENLFCEALRLVFQHVYKVVKVVRVDSRIPVARQRSSGN